jgi:hypothetical protein
MEKTGLVIISKGLNIHGWVPTVRIIYLKR